jgi:hypothetical protein
MFTIFMNSLCRSFALSQHLPFADHYRWYGNASGAKCFSSLDLTSGYQQLMLDPSNHPKPALTHTLKTMIGRCFLWPHVGLANAPAVFKNTMHQIFGPRLNKSICVYLDDVLIFSKSWEECAWHLFVVLNILRQYNLK